MDKLCLGTVQFGMKYGINNKLGQPSLQDSFGMLDLAIDKGIVKIDTAAQYGMAEEILGKYFASRKNQNKVEIISKLRPNSMDSISIKDIPNQVRIKMQESLNLIGVEQLDGYLLHTPAYIYNDAVMEGMVRGKDEGLVKHIGISIYEIDDGFAAIDTGVIDYIQLPYSILDQRGDVTEFMKQAKDHGITVYARSAFLQGLIMMREDEIPTHLDNSKRYLRIFNDILRKYEVDKITALIHFVTDNKNVDYLVFGIDTREQLLEDIDKARNCSVPAEFLMEVKQSLQGIEKSIIFPSLWAKK